MRISEYQNTSSKFDSQLPCAWIDERPVTSEDVDFILSAAFDGADYWITKVMIKVRPSHATKYFSEVLTRAGSLSIKDSDGGWHELTLNKFLKGLTLYIQGFKYGGNFRPGKGFSIIEDHDANDADCILQLALFDDVIYG